ncbi:leucine-rich receptor-like protein kinase family protein, partial [Striga asiatica]
KVIEEMELIRNEATWMVNKGKLLLMGNYSIHAAATVKKQALMKFKKQLVDPLNYLESWKDSYSDSDSDSHCRFYGVLCDKKIGSRLSRAEKLHKFQNLNVSNNDMNGTVPDLSSLKKLVAHDLCDNEYSGPFLEWVGSLPELTWLSLGGNSFDEGEIPEY